MAKARPSALRLLAGFGEGVGKCNPDPVERSRLDQDIIEDADTRHEQFTEEADRWRDDCPDART